MMHRKIVCKKARKTERKTKNQNSNTIEIKKVNKERTKEIKQARKKESKQDSSKI